MYTLGQLKSEVKALVFPAGIPENLVVAIDAMFVDAIVDLQICVECQQQDNTDLFPHCSTLYNCGLTVFDAPRGHIKELSVIDKSTLFPSGNLTASKTGDIVTSSEPFFDASMVGSLITFNDGQTFKISEFSDSTHVVVSNIVSAPPASVPTVPLPSSTDGEWPLVNGVDYGTVTGLALTRVPRRVLASVRIPAAGDLNIEAHVVTGSITTDGFTFQLDGMPDNNNYKLDYVLIF